MVYMNDYQRREYDKILKNSDYFEGVSKQLKTILETIKEMKDAKYIIDYKAKEKGIDPLKELADLEDFTHSLYSYYSRYAYDYLTEIAIDEQIGNGRE